MDPMRRMSISELAAEHLRTGLRSGRWGETLPGVARLAQDLDVSRHTLRTALRQLETEGILTARGLGRSRCITTAGANIASQRPLRVAILRHDARLTDNTQTSAVLIEIMHSLEAVGHTVFFCNKSQIELRHDVRRIVSELEKKPADAWIVEAGSRPLLEWCASQQTPCLALYGRTGDLPLARTGPDVLPACRAATRHLLALGHRRIVFIVSETGRKPVLGITQRVLLDDLIAHGIQTSSYNLPDWEETPKGLWSLLESLFRHTPPTALIIDELPWLIATVTFLVRHGIKVPEQVSLVGTFCDGSLDWCQPGISRLQWENRPIVHRVVRWVDTVRKGKPDRNVINSPAEFVPGGSTGPVWKG